METMTISVVKGRGSLNHNNREFATPNVDKDRISDNITYVAEPLEVAYEKCFGAEIERYNSTQKRADRRIDGAKGYMEQIRNSKNGEKLFYETVVQVGNKHDCAVGTENGELAKQILDGYMREFQSRNPNLYVFNAVLHLDEATPHLHIDYIPLAHDYQRGLQVRNSLDKALKEQGIDGKANKRENSTHNWQEREKTAVERVMREYGLEREPEKGIKREHMTVEQYKAVAEQVRNEVEQLPQQIETAPMMLNKERVTVRKTDLEQLEQRAKLSLVHEKATKEAQRATEQSFSEGKQYITKKMSQSLMYLDEAEKSHQQAGEELRQAREARSKYEQLYQQQQSLNENYAKLYKLYQSEKQTTEQQKETITALRAENSSLKAQIEERVQKAVEPLKRQIEGLTERLQNVAKSIACMAKAVGMLKYDKGEYRAELSKKQGEVVDAVAEYAKGWIKNTLGECEQTTELQTDIDKHVSISEGIKRFMSPDYPEILYFKGGKEGRGFYDKENRFYGTLEIMPELKKQGVKIIDPHELLPGNRSR